MNDNKSRDIFYGVVAIATLIVALIGATLAYFSISASSNEGAVNATADTVSISYNDGQQVTAQADKLIPASIEVVKEAYSRSRESFGSEGAMSDNICIDDNDRQVCSIYRFSVTSDSNRDIVATLNSEANGFTTGLSYAVYDVSGEYASDEARWQQLDDSIIADKLTLNYCSNEDEDTNKYCFNTIGGVKDYGNNSHSIFGYDNGGVIKTKSITASETQVYDLVIFLNENNLDQNADQGKQYSGTLVVKIVDSGSAGGIITGTINND